MNVIPRASPPESPQFCLLQVVFNICKPKPQEAAALFDGFISACDALRMQSISHILGTFIGINGVDRLCRLHDMKFGQQSKSKTLNPAGLQFATRHCSAGY